MQLTAKAVDNASGPYLNGFTDGPAWGYEGPFNIKDESTPEFTRRRLETVHSMLISISDLAHRWSPEGPGLKSVICYPSMG